MKSIRTAVLIAALTLTVSGFAAAQEIEWVCQFGTPSEDAAIGVCADAGGIYVVGKTFGALPGQTSAGSQDAFVRKHDAAGTESWTCQFGTYTVDEALGVAVYGGDIYVAGWTAGTLPGQSSSGYLDAFVRKYDADGAEVWTHQFGTSSEDNALGVSIDADGNIYVVGYVGGSMPDQTSAGGPDAFVRKYDAAGNEAWTRQFGTSQHDYVRGVSAHGGAVYVAGWTYGTLPGQTGSEPIPDAFVRKYDASGNEVWTRQFGTSGYDDAYGVTADAQAISVTGKTDGVFPGQTDLGASDIYVRKYDAAGTELWTYQFGTSYADLPGGICTYGVGVYVAGRTCDGTFPGQTSAGGEDAFVVKLSPANHPPTAETGGPYTVDEGAVVEMTAAGTDPDQDLLTYDWDLDNDGVFETPGQEVTFSAATLDGPTSQEVVVRVTDDGGLSAISQTTIEILNVPPSLSEILVPGAPVHIGEGIAPSATFEDPGILDSHSGEWDWGDGSMSDALISDAGGSGTATGSHVYSDPGVYTVTLTVTDDDGGSDQAISQFVVIYDPTAGYVTGGGSINSPEGAYAFDPSLAGKAQFGFVSRYQKGAAVPSGNTQFHFQVADLRFSSTDYQWLVVAGPKAQYKGSGVINGEGDYGFILTAVDGQRPGGGDVDKFRIKIWDKATEEIVYDNQMGEPDGNDPVLAISGGNIAIHDGSGGGSQAYRHREAIPSVFDLLQNFPNPTQNGTTIRFSIPEMSRVVLIVYDTIGRAVAVLVDQELPPGAYSVTWKTEVPAGNYFYRIQAGEFTATKRMTVIR